MPLVGGKNASLDEMTREFGALGTRVPDGYAVTADAYRHFLDANGLVAEIRAPSLEVSLSPGGSGGWERRTLTLRAWGAGAPRRSRQDAWTPEG